MRKTILAITIIVAMAAIVFSYFLAESEGTGILLCILIMSAYGITDIKKDDNKLI